MFYSLPNLSSSTAVELAEPWAYKPATPPPYDQPKTGGWLTWMSASTTQHAFISGYEGLTATVRINDSNPAYRLHAIIADYDGLVSRADIEKFQKKGGPGGHRPAYAVITKSGKVRLVWLLERPLMLVGDAQIKAFLKVVKKELALHKWAAGFDTEAYAKPGMYYEVGREWVPLEPAVRIPSSVAELWIIRATEGIQLVETDGLRYQIPIDEIAAAVAEKFPDRWPGTFSLGSRGPRFWDPTADRMDAAVVKPDGMLCFTGPSPFVPWKAIFGKEFVEKYEADYVARAMAGVYYDGRCYWVSLDGGSSYVDMSDTNFMRSLKVRGFHTDKRSSDSCSEVDRIMDAIVRNNRVDGAIPLLFQSAGIVTLEWDRFLNLSRNRLTPPTTPIESVVTTDFHSFGRTHFPFVHRLLCCLFGSKMETDGGLVDFLAWLSYFYKSSVAGQPTPGQLTVLAGPPNSGKTLLARRVIGGLMGGFADAGKHLLNGERWTGALADKPVWVVDDGEATADYADARKFTQRIKAYVANSSLLYEKKYKDAIRIPWMGRIMISCNMDLESMRIIPGMDMATRDKISLYKCSDDRMDFPTVPEIDRALAVELPFFARFLLDWAAPESCYVPGVTRFGGIKPHHDAEMMEASLEHGMEGLLLEVLIPFLQEYKEGHVGSIKWTGPGVLLHSDLSTMFPEAMREIKQRGLVTSLGNLAKNGFPVWKTKDPESGQNVWHIEYDLYGKRRKGIYVPKY